MKGGVYEVIGGQNNGGEGKGARAHKGNFGWDMGGVLGEDGKLKEAKLEVIRIVRKNSEMVKWVFIGA